MTANPISPDLIAGTTANPVSPDLIAGMITIPITPDHTGRRTSPAIRAPTVTIISPGAINHSDLQEERADMDFPGEM
jgi:hypothetical protein